MGRSKYSEEDRLRIITSFIRCAREIIDLEGVEQVSIRRVAQNAGFNSATMYLYFKDADELITLASIGYLESYCRTLVADIPHLKSPYEVYIYTWKIFSQHAFASPQVFYHLFYSTHSLPLSQTVARYYEIYPAQQVEEDFLLRGMLMAGELKDRNMQVLRPLGEEMGLSEETMGMINDLTTCYFKKLLEEHLNESSAILAERKTNKMLQVLDFLLGVSQKTK